MRKIITFLIVLILLWYIWKEYVLTSRNGLKENWQDYTVNPFGYVYSGSDPLYFYSYDRYRKPYRWPFQYYASYPYPHLSPLP